MRRARRERIDKSYYFKRTIYLSVGILIAILLTFIITIIVYNNKLKEYSYSSLSTEKIADLVPNLSDETEIASNPIGKTIEEVIETQGIEEDEENNKKIVEEINKVEERSQEVTEEVIVKDPEFISPVEGEILRGYAKDSLIYSNTLEEWIVHLGIDIKAERTTVVKAAEAGTVSLIKNDPRYGLTIVVEHTNGFKTVYSNLLTTEFVTEGEKVEKGQSLGTVGNSAAFEIVDEPHLHFEILKDDVNVDPNIYLK